MLLRIIQPQERFPPFSIELIAHMCRTHFCTSQIFRLILSVDPILFVKVILSICCLFICLYCLGQVEEKRTKNGTWIAIPALNYSPENGFGFGGATFRVFKFNQKDTISRSSQIGGLALYTTKNQAIFSTRYQFFTYAEKFSFSGQVRYVKFPEFYYGVGQHTPNSNEERVSYQFFRFTQRVLKQVVPGLFTGAEFRYFHRYDLELTDGGLLESTQVAGYDGSKVAGIGPVFVLDKRDNINNCFRGYYLLFSAFFHGKVLGGQFQYTNYRIDFRDYFRPFKNREDIIAFQFLGNFIEGTAPFRQLSLLGGNSIMRGYYFGRFRDQHLIAAQVEYRVPLFWKLGAAGFVGYGNVLNRLDEFRFQDLKPSIGGGIRFKVDDKERLNLRLDMGFGEDTSGFYISVAEAF